MASHTTHPDAPVRLEQNIRRLATGAIDYAFYDARARHHRGIAFRAAGRALSAVVRRLVGVVKAARPAHASNGQAPTRSLPPRARHRRAAADAPRRPVSKAA